MTYQVKQFCQLLKLIQWLFSFDTRDDPKYDFVHHPLEHDLQSDGTYKMTFRAKKVYVPERDIINKKYDNLKPSTIVITLTNWDHFWIFKSKFAGRSPIKGSELLPWIGDMLDSFNKKNDIYVEMKQDILEECTCNNSVHDVLGPRISHDYSYVISYCSINIYG